MSRRVVISRPHASILKVSQVTAVTGSLWQNSLMGDVNYFEPLRRIFASKKSCTLLGFLGNGVVEEQRLFSLSRPFMLSP